VTPDDIRRVLSEKVFPGSDPRGIECTGPVYASIKSELFVARCRDWPDPVAVKCYLDEAAVGTYGNPRLQSALHSRLKCSNLDSCIPLAILEEERVIVTKWIDAPTLESRLKSPFVSTKQLDSDIFRVATWLRLFHHSFHGPRRNFQADEIYGRLVKSRGAEAWPPDPVFQAAYAVLGQYVGEASLCKIRFGIAHGDFKPANVLITPSRTVVVDLDNLHYGLQLGDLAYFANNISIALQEPWGYRFVRKRRKLISAVAKGYLAHENRQDYGIYLWIRLHGLLRFWLRANRTHNSVIKNTVYIGMIKTEIAHLVEAISEFFRSESSLSGHFGIND
jgi:hypothetical protein